MSEKTSGNGTIHSGEPWCMESVHARFGKGRLETCPASGNALTAYFTPTDKKLLKGPLVEPPGCANPSPDGGQGESCSGDACDVGLAT